jgi:ribosomal protein S16
MSIVRFTRGEEVWDIHVPDAKNNRQGRKIAERHVFGYYDPLRDEEMPPSNGEGWEFSKYLKQEQYDQEQAEAREEAEAQAMAADMARQHRIQERATQIMNENLS